MIEITDISHGGWRVDYNEEISVILYGVIIWEANNIFRAFSAIIWSLRGYYWALNTFQANSLIVVLTASRHVSNKLQQAHSYPAYLS